MRLPSVTGSSTPEQRSLDNNNNTESNNVNNDIIIIIGEHAVKSTRVPIVSSAALTWNFDCLPGRWANQIQMPIVLHGGSISQTVFSPRGVL